MNSKKSTKIKILPLALVLIMVLGAGILAMGSFANSGVTPVPANATEITVSTWADFQTHFNAVPEGSALIINLSADISMVAGVHLAVLPGRDITIRSAPSGPRREILVPASNTLAPDWGGGATPLNGKFAVQGTLRLENIQIRGERHTNAHLLTGGVHVRGADARFYMGNDAVITASRTITSQANPHRPGGAVTVDYGATFIMNGGEITDSFAHSGGGVSVIGVGTTFIMNGGEIRENIISTNTTNNRAGGGGGVLVASGGSFTMNNGLIAGNIISELLPTASSHLMSGGGVDVVGNGSEFIMNGGEISGHDTAVFGGGVAVRNGATFEMNNNAQIINNTAQHGGGVFVNNGSEFTMNAGLIDSNLSTADAVGSDGGGGIRVLDSASAFTMNNGVISNNTSARHGGGVLVHSALAEFNGGSIIGNGAADLGGGVMLHHATAVMTGGTIGGDGTYDGNTSTIAAGIMIESSTFDMEGGSIVGNIARQSGGGIRIGGTNSRTTTMHDGAVIRGNRAGSGGTGAGGAIDIVGTGMNFIMNGGSIIGNTAVSQGGAVRINSSATMTMNNGIIAGNNAGGNGGGVFVNNGTLTVNGGSFFGNHTDRDGGGIFYAGHPAGYSVPLVATDYPRLTVAASVVFRHNTAGNGAFVPHESATAITRIAVRYPNTSVQWHPLNNFDINFRSDGEYIPSLVDIEKELVTPEGTPIPPNMTFHFNVDFISWNGVTPTNPNWPDWMTAPSIANVLIPVTGNGTTVNGITTRLLTGGIIADFTWDTTGEFVFRITELQTLAPHTLGAGENMIFSEVEYILHVFVARCQYSEVAYAREIVIFDATDVDGELNENHKVYDIVFVNVYTVDAGEGLTVTKTVVGEFADTSFPFQFAITLTLDEIFQIDTFTGVIRNAAGTIVDTVTFTNGVTSTIGLAHGWSITFNDIPVGTQFRAVETYVIGYTTTIDVTGAPDTINGLDTENQLVQELGSTAAFTNDFDRTPGTGLNIGNASVIGLVVLAVGSLGVFIAVKAKKARV